MHAAITAVGHYLPEDRITNADLEKLVDTNDEWIRSRTGIRERRVLKDPTKATSFMASAAARMALEKSGTDPADVDCIIVGTVTPDMVFPATACLVADQIGATKAWGFDMSAACSGFIFALATGAQFVQTGKHKKVLVIGGDKMTSIMDYTDRTSCIIFGDGAGAVLLEPNSDGLGVIDSVEHSDGSHADKLRMLAGGSLNPASIETVEKRMHYLQQDGKAIFKEAVVGMADVVEEIMQRNELTGDDIRFLIPHQANQRIIDATARRSGIAPEKVTINIDRYGNTTAGTIPLCLADWESQFRPDDKLILTAFGGGLTWGAVYIKWAYDGSKYAQPHPALEADAVTHD